MIEIPTGLVTAAAISGTFAVKYRVKPDKAVEVRDWLQGLRIFNCIKMETRKVRLEETCNS